MTVPESVSVSLISARSTWVIVTSTTVPCVVLRGRVRTADCRKQHQTRDGDDGSLAHAVVFPQSKGAPTVSSRAANADCAATRLSRYSCSTWLALRCASITVSMFAFPAL